MAPITAGVVVSFNHSTNLATIRCTHPSGRGFKYYELPWNLSGNGIFLADPTPETDMLPGTHAVVGFRGSDYNYPILLASYDPMYASVTRKRNKRNLSSYTTRTDKAIAGSM